MPWTQTEFIEAPYNGSNPTAEACSQAGARAALPRAGSQAARLLALYRAKGPQTDHEARKALRLPLSTINARRAVLVARGLVRAKGCKPGPWGVKNTLYGVV